MDIRNRECGRHTDYKIEDAEYVTREYSFQNGANTDYFISLESRDRKVIFGFLRLRIPNKGIHKPVFECLKDAAMIRELHVYGEVVPVGFAKENVSQHKGVGKKLLEMAEEISYTNGRKKIAVISGIGVKKYYEKHNYKQMSVYDGDFLVKDLTYEQAWKRFPTIYLVFLSIIIIYNIITIVM